MVFVREINKGGRIYRYLYKSKRINGKVKSIYVGREKIKSSKKTNAHRKIHAKGKKINIPRKDDKWIIDKIIEFNKLMEESMNLLITDKVESAANHYNKLLGVYNELSNHVSDEEKLKLYDKTKQVYDRIQELTF